MQENMQQIVQLCETHIDTVIYTNVTIAFSACLNNKFWLHTAHIIPQ